MQTRDIDFWFIVFRSGSKFIFENNHHDFASVHSWLKTWVMSGTEAKRKDRKMEKIGAH